MSRSNEFRVNQLWDQKRSSFCKPTIIGSYSVDKDRKPKYDLSQLKYLSHNIVNGQEIRINLEGSYKNYVKRQNLNERLDHLLRWIVTNSKNLQNTSRSDRWLLAEFISYRGLLTKILTTPFEKRDGWIICAMKFRGSIYLCGFETDEDKRRKEQMSPREERLCAYGYIFEHFLLSDDPAKFPDTEGPIYDAEEFNCVMHSRLGSHSLCYGAEMDGVRSSVVIDEKVNLNHVSFVELKTTAKLKNSFQEKNLIKKMLKWWCQSYLAGINEIIVGYRTDYGVVNQIQTHITNQLPEMAKHHNSWNSHAPINFANEFLSFVKRIVTKNYNECVYKFTWVPNTNVIVTELSPTDEFAFLPSWFTIPASTI